MSSHVPQAYSTCRYLSVHWELWMHSLGVMNIHRQQRSMAGGRRMGFQSVLFFFTAPKNLHISAPSKSWDFFDPATNIHRHLLWDKVIWMVSPQHVHPQQTIWEPWRVELTQNFHTWGPDCKPTLVGSEMLWERDVFVYFNDFFFKNAVLCLVFGFLSQLLCIFSWQFWYFRGFRIQNNRSCTLFQPWSTMIHQAKNKVPPKNVQNFTEWNLATLN